MTNISGNPEQNSEQAIEQNSEQAIEQTSEQAIEQNSEQSFAKRGQSLGKSIGTSLVKGTSTLGKNTGKAMGSVAGGMVSGMTQMTNIITRNPLADALNNRPVKMKIAMIVVPLIFIALYGIGNELWSGYARYRHAKTLEQANIASDFILRAAGLQAKERGFTATALSNALDKNTVASIPILRISGDVALDSALVIARNYSQG
jgi:hypothetical protein